MKEKWVIYHSDAYYPYADEFDSEKDARTAWDKLREKRLDEDVNYFDRDYLAKVIEENGELR
jgi:hypothetical protein